MTEEEKAPYYRKQKADKTRYNIETRKLNELGYYINKDGKVVKIKNYVISKTGEVGDVKNANEDSASIMVPPVKPKKVLAAYFYYMADNFKHCKEQFPNMKYA